ncbi:universal stress protein [Bacillaceae bacterium ZC4]|uniref:universal stress protein n=1 Tax=Aeribacillus sp. FSL K6-1305 TaxID=2954569 RepID=UPI00118D3B33|nr:universal stress protein [Bacillaceae bacterium ZC4]MDR9794866.1 universal stress protein [Aeribacillus pallidus]
MYKKILVPMDGSAHSTRALEHAVKLAKTVGSEKITILHVNNLRFTEQYYFVDISKLIDEENEAILKPAIEFLTESNVPHETHIFQGEPATIITDYAKEHEYSIIVMGSAGKGALKATLLGSVSRKVAQEAHCPVLIIK